jgi:TorA maturation chaperone TorD
MQAVAAGRAKTYAALSALYLAPPTQAQIDSLRADGFLAAFRDAVGSMTESELAAEHTRLLVLPSGVVPHESMYLDENKRVGGRVTAGVQQFYDSAGAKLTKACLELPDHIGVELEFMSFLCDIEAQLRAQRDVDGLQQCLRFQHNFLSGHLLRWYRALCDRILGDSSSEAYRALARLTIAFLEAEGELLPRLIDELDSESRTVCVPEI